jgi:glycosyltransferase involved in cell wall biosynthesis
MAHRIPVVSFDLAETQKSAGSAGRYVAWVGDPEVDQRGYALAILELLDDPDRRALMGRDGRARIENGLGWPTQAARYVGAYDRLLGRDSPSPELVTDAPRVRPFARRSDEPSVQPEAAAEGFAA